MPSNWINRLRSKITDKDEASDTALNPRRSLLWIGIALLLAGFAQYVFSQGLVLLAILDLVVATWIFVVNVRPFFVEKDVGEQELPASSSTVLEAGSGIDSEHEPAPSRDPVLPENAGMTQRWEFVKHHWRELTIYEIFTGSFSTQLAEASASPTSISTPSPAVIDEEPGSTHAPDQSLSTVDEVGTTALEEPITPRRQGQITRLSGGDTQFSQPKAVATTPSGDVLVLDVGREIVYRLDPDGEYLGEWAVSGLNQLHVYDLTVSPDGETIYLIDKDDQSVYKIELD